MACDVSPVAMFFNIMDKILFKSTDRNPTVGLFLDIMNKNLLKITDCNLTVGLIRSDDIFSNIINKTIFKITNRNPTVGLIRSDGSITGRLSLDSANQPYCRNHMMMHISF